MDHFSEALTDALTHTAPALLPNGHDTSPDAQAPDSVSGPAVKRKPRILSAMPQGAADPAKPAKRTMRAASKPAAKAETVAPVARVKRVSAQTIAALKAHRSRALQEIATIGKPRSKAQIARVADLTTKVAAYDAKLGNLKPTRASKAAGSAIALRATLTRMNKRLKTLAGAARRAYRAEIAKVQAKLDALTGAVLA